MRRPPAADGARASRGGGHGAGRPGGSPGAARGAGAASGVGGKGMERKRKRQATKISPEAGLFMLLQAVVLSSPEAAQAAEEVLLRRIPGLSWEVLRKAEDLPAEVTE